jgi:hypothetical protein
MKTEALNSCVISYNMAGGYQLFETTFIFGINQFKKSGLFDPEDESAMIFRNVPNNLPNGTT